MTNIHISVTWCPLVITFQRGCQHCCHCVHWQIFTPLHLSLSRCSLLHSQWMTSENNCARFWNWVGWMIFFFCLLKEGGGKLMYSYGVPSLILMTEINLNQCRWLRWERVLIWRKGRGKHSDCRFMKMYLGSTLTQLARNDSSWLDLSPCSVALTGNSLTPWCQAAVRQGRGGGEVHFKT